jgi:hypothetical protein
MAYTKYIQKPKVYSLRVCAKCQIKAKTNEGYFLIYNNGLREKFVCKSCKR